MTDQNDIPLRDALEQYLDARQEDSKPQTLANKRNQLGRWIDWLREEHGVTSTADLCNPHLAEYTHANPAFHRVTVLARAMSLYHFILFLNGAGFITDEQMMDLRQSYRDTKEECREK